MWHTELHWEIQDEFAALMAVDETEEARLSWYAHPAPGMTGGRRKFHEAVEKKPRLKLAPEQRRARRLQTKREWARKNYVPTGKPVGRPRKAYATFESVPRIST